jgi:hypothetical protein
MVEWKIGDWTAEFDSLDQIRECVRLYAEQNLEDTTKIIEKEVKFEDEFGDYKSIDSEDLKKLKANTGRIVCFQNPQNFVEKYYNKNKLHISTLFDKEKKKWVFY